MPHVAISDSFLQAFSRVPKAQQKKVREFMEKFRADPTQASIHFEPIHDMKDDKVRTVRIGDNYRAIVIQPPTGDVFLCVWVDHHDEAMAWARNKRFEVNPAIGSLQVFEVSDAVVREAPKKSGQSEKVPDNRLLSGFDNEDLILCGVPEALLPAVRAMRTEGDLNELSKYLPAEAADALVILAAGGTVTEAIEESGRSREKTPAKVDTNDFATALQHPDSQRRFKLVENEQELMEMLSAPLERWRVFLHPSQRAIVRKSAGGAVRVLGGAGTGKTVVAMHRARFLATEVFKSPEDRILFTTFTKNLARDIERQLKSLCGPEFARIEVVNLHQWASRFLKGRGVNFDILLDEKRKRAFWDEAYTEAENDDFSPSFYRDEWEKVVQANDITTRDGYLQARRAGRGTRVSRAQRAAIWKVLGKYRALLDGAGKVEYADLVREARLYLEKHPGTLPYRAVIADEVQDMRTADLMLLRTLVPPGPNDLFLVGDAHQRIYGQRASLGACGIQTRGRSHRLKINYRTTEKIRDWGVALLEGMNVDDLDEETDTLKGYRSLRLGESPELKHFKTGDEELKFIVAKVKSWIASGAPEEVCVVARTNALVNERYKPALAKEGIKVAVINTDSDDNDPGVRVATMHRVKGLEFPRVLIASVQAGVMPLDLGVESLPDAAAREDHEADERRLLFVAATRARDELVVSGYGKNTPFFDEHNNRAARGDR